MTQGTKSAYTSKQKRQAKHIEKSYTGRGVSKKTAASRAWATVNKQTGGGKRSGSGRKSSASGTSKTKNRTIARTSAARSSSRGRSSTRGTRAGARR